MQNKILIIMVKIQNMYSSNVHTIYYICVCIMHIQFFLVIYKYIIIINDKILFDIRII